jgi:hypothetical protein
MGCLAFITSRGPFDKEDDAPFKVGNVSPTAWLPSGYEVESELPMIIKDADVADQFNEVYALFVDHLDSLNASPPPSRPCL